MWPPPYTQTILPCSEGASAQEEKRTQPVALKQQDAVEDEKATIDFLSFFCDSFCEILLLALLFECGVCLKCNLGTIYDISTGAQNKTHNYMCGQRWQGVSQHDASRTALFLHRTRSIFLSTEKYLVMFLVELKVFFLYFKGLICERVNANLAANYAFTFWVEVNLSLLLLLIIMSW